MAAGDSVICAGGGRPSTDHGRAMRIGPNAITQLHTVLLRERGAAETRAIFDAAGIPGHLDNPPEAMVDEREVARLHAEVRSRCNPERARDLMRAAGDATGAYILANRIPPAIALLLRRLPARWSSRLLARAIAKHAWTFAGSGGFAIAQETRGSEGIAFADIRSNPVVALDRSAHPICDWHAAVFGKLYRDLVSDRSGVVERACCAAGDDACRFEIRFPLR